MFLIEPHVGHCCILEYVSFSFFIVEDFFFFVWGHGFYISPEIIGISDSYDFVGTFGFYLALQKLQLLPKKKQQK